MSLFDNGEPEKFLLFVRNFNMTFAASGTLEAVAKYWYLWTIVCGEALHEFEFSADIESTETLNIDCIITGLAQ